MMMKKTEDRSSIRDENIVWTVSRDYDRSPSLELVDKTGIDSLDRYRMVIFGMLYREDHSSILSYCIQKREATRKLSIFSELMILTMEEMFHTVLRQNFSGLRDMQDVVLEDVARFYDKMRKRGDASHEIRYAYYAMKKGVVPKSNRRVIDLLDEIVQFRDMERVEYISKMENLLKKHFHFEKIAEIELKDPEIERKEQSDRHRADRGKLRHVDRAIDIGDQEQVMSAEFSQVDIGRIAERMKKDQADDPMDAMTAEEGRIYQKIVERYGMPTITGPRLADMERRLSIGIHQGERLHITDRFMQIEGYKKQILLEQTQENTDHFDHQHRIYRRNIARLVEKLTRTIMADTDHSPNKLDNGMVMSSQIWRKAIIGDNKVFYKNIRDTRGRFVVDILLDASGSQIERQSLVAAQGYIIAEALSQVGIPCRVSSFNNLFDYLILKVYRDHKDPRSKNRQIFSYQAEGSNRDGMAVAVVGDMLMEREEEHKVLIVLSDGKPNDERVGGAFNTISSKTKPYTGDIAVDDTAHQVRSLRAKEIAVLGVFTGEDEDLEAERRIFGKDLAYITKIERFSEVVGTYLKRQITNVLAI